MQNQNNSQPSGFDNLLEVHTRALEENSKSVVEILELLSDKQLSIKDRKNLNRIKRELKNIDTTIDSLGEEVEPEEDEECSIDWWS